MTQLCWKCDYCGGHLEVVNGYVRCVDCHVSEWSSDELRPSAEERRKAFGEYLKKIKAEREGEV